MGTPREFSYDELHDLPVAVQGCANCHGTPAEGYSLSIVHTDDGERLLLCDDCAQENSRMEKLADSLAALPSCEYRQSIIDAGLTVRQMVNALRAHDFLCVACGSTRKTVTDDRLYVRPDAVCCDRQVA